MIKKFKLYVTSLYNDISIYPKEEEYNNLFEAMEALNTVKLCYKLAVDHGNYIKSEIVEDNRFRFSTKSITKDNISFDQAAWIKTIE